MHSVDKLIELIKKVRSIDGKELAEWGKMEIQHMLEHNILMFKISTGKIKVNLLVDEDKIEIYKESVLRNEPFEKNLKNPLLGEEPTHLVFKDVETAKKKLIEEFNNFIQYFDDASDKKTLHPILGLIDKDIWVKFHIKHLSHHLVQFGLHEYGDSVY